MANTTITFMGGATGQTPIPIRAIDNGDSTFTMATGPSGGLTGTKGAPLAVTVGTTPVRIGIAGTSRKRSLIQNLGTARVYLGRDNTVAVGTGYALGYPGDSISNVLVDSASTDAWYGVSTADQDVRVVEIS